MKRRSFIKSGSIASVPVILNGVQVSSFFSPSLLNLLNGDNDRILVLVQLIGGNDGLNTLIPLDQYTGLTAIRNSVLIPQSKVIKLNPLTGLHPAMSDLNMVWQDGQLQCIQSVGYPDQNRSHFRSQDIWYTASDANEFISTGWIGRYLDDTFPGYPNGFPNAECPDPIAVSIGNNVSETCQGTRGNFSLSVVDPNNISILDDPNLEPVPNNCYGMELSFLREAVKQTNSYSDRIKIAAAKGNNLSTKYGVNNSLGQKLKTVAKLISGGLKTKIYIVNMTGFDTHGNQVNASDTTTGLHANLLNQLANGICAFQDDLKKMGLEKRVIGMTFSEFGRRIKTTALGTDHGSAAPMFLFGSCINPIILGNNPQISTSTTDQEGVAMQYDFRSVYGSILNQWLKLDDAKVKQIINPSYQSLPIILGCEITDTYDVEKTKSFKLKLYANVITETLKFSIDTLNDDQFWMELYNEEGYILSRRMQSRTANDTNEISLDFENYTSGIYYLRVANKMFQETERIVKVGNRY